MIDIKKRETLLTRAAELFDLPADAIAGQMSLTMTGQRRLRIENHRGLLEYGNELIAVNTGGAVLRIYGSGLELAAMTADDLTVTGTLHRIEFENI
ncbi:MAG: sporulation protein [Oscillospiraceae bacterium]|nr:sporulation protein [Oscillospiraceae bacterium]